MAADHSFLGRCPHCDAVVPAAYLRIADETTDGNRQMVVEWPDWSAVVKPTDEP